MSKFKTPMSYRILLLSALIFLPGSGYTFCQTLEKDNTKNRFILSAAPTVLLMKTGANEKMMSLLIGMELKGIYALSESEKLHANWEAYTAGGIYLDLQDFRTTAVQLRLGLRKINNVKMSSFYVFWGPSAFVVFPSGQSLAKAIGLEFGTYYGDVAEIALSMYLVKQQEKTKGAFQMQTGFTFHLF
jgi:hypothetical protein